MARQMALGERPAALAFSTMMAFWAGVQLTGIRAVVRRFWLPLRPVFFMAVGPRGRTQAARLGRGTEAARRRFAGQGRDCPAAVDGRTALLPVHGGTRLGD